MPPVPADPGKPATPAAHTDPWTALLREVDHLFDRFSHGFGQHAPRAEAGAFPVIHCPPIWPATMPVVDIAESETCFKMMAELPGLTEDDVEVSVANGTLVLKGEKHQEKDVSQQNYRLAERSYGAFQRSFTLPDTVDAEQICAEFDKGVLTVTLPKRTEAPAAQGKKIAVKPAA